MILPKTAIWLVNGEFFARIASISQTPLGNTEQFYKLAPIRHTEKSEDPKITGNELLVHIKRGCSSFTVFLRMFGSSEQAFGRAELRGFLWAMPSEPVQEIRSIWLYSIEAHGAG